MALGRHHESLRQDFMAAFDRVLRTSAFTLGEEVERFETEFAEYCGARHCVGVASGTAALELLLRASGVGTGDEVIVPAHTFIASALAVVHAGATPVLCDVDDSTGLIDPDAVRALIGPRTAAIMAVHLYGQTCDMTALARLARSHGLVLLEDAAQAHGAVHRGRRAGSLGTGAAFSFYPSKNLGALGDGGAICTDDGELAMRVRRLRNLGQRAKGEHLEIGYNQRLDGLQAALLRVKLVHLDGWNDRRRDRAELYRALLPQAITTVEERPENACVYHLFPVRVRGRDHLAASLLDRGVQTGIHYYPAVHAHPAWEEGSLRHGEVANAEAWAAEELSLPMHPDLEREEIEYVVENLAASVAGIGAPS